MFEIKRLDHVGFPTDDLDRTSSFCEDVLALASTPSLPTGFDGYRLAWYCDPAGVEYHVSERIPDLPKMTGSTFNQSMYPHVAFEVGDIEDVKRTLDDRGIEFHELRGEGIRTRHQVYVLLEPFGMMFEFFQTKEEARA